MQAIAVVLAILAGFAASIYLIVRIWRRYASEGWLTKVALILAIVTVAPPSVGMFASAIALEPEGLQQAIGRVIAGLILTSPIVALAIFLDRRIARIRAR